MRAIISDIDKTIVSYATERDFLKYMLKKGRISVFYLIKNFLLFLIKHPEQADRYAHKRFKYYVKGKDVKDCKKQANECFDACIKKKIIKKVVNEFNALKKKGFKLVLITGSAHFIVKPLADYLKADYVIATRLEIKNNKYTGEIIGEQPFWHNKSSIIRQFAKRHKIDLKKSISFGDHRTDIDFMVLTGQTIAINPDSKLKRFALKKGWRIIN